MRLHSARLTVVLAALAASCSLGALADDRSEIKALYAKLSKAMKAKDVKTIMATGTPDFVSIHPGAPPMDAKTTAQMMQSQFKLLKSVDHVSMTADKITIKGRQAVVNGKYSMKAKMAGANGQTQVLTDKGTSKDTLVKTPKGWRFKKSEMVTMDPKVDGKPMLPPSSTPTRDAERRGR